MGDILMSHHSNSTWLFMRINLQLQTSDFADLWLCRPLTLWSLLWLQQIPKNPLTVQSYITAKSTSTKSEVCNCKLIRINNQVLLDDGIRIIIPQGNFKVLQNLDFDPDSDPVIAVQSKSGIILELCNVAHISKYWVWRPKISKILPVEMPQVDSNLKVVLILQLVWVVSVTDTFDVYSGAFHHYHYFHLW